MSGYITHIVVDMCQRNSASDIDTAFVFLFEVDVRWTLVDPNTEAFQLRFDNSFVGQGLVDVQHDEYQMTSLCDGNNLPTSSFTVFRSLNDTRQVQHLYLGAVVYHLSRDGGELRII